MTGATLQSIPADLVFRNVKGQADRGHYLPLDNTVDLGASGATRFRDLFLAGAWKEGTVSMNLLPNADATRDLGASGTRFKDLYLSGEVKGGQVFTLIADFNANNFDSQIGAPDNALRGSGGSNVRVKAWALDPAANEAIGGAVFVVPESLSIGDVTLDFDLLCAMSGNGAAGEDVVNRVEFAILSSGDQIDEASVTASATTSVATKVTDEFYVARISPATSFVAGDVVRLSVVRLASNAADDHPLDQWIIGVKVYAYLKK